MEKTETHGKGLRLKFSISYGKSDQSQGVRKNITIVLITRRSQVQILTPLPIKSRGCASGVAPFSLDCDKIVI